MINLARSIDLLSLAFALGATLWFFFIQSPLLVRAMGRPSFVPLQMRLTVVLFTSLCISLLLMLGAALVHSAGSITSTVIAASVALAGATINKFLVLPRALRAGSQTMREDHPPDELRSVAKFASEGGGAAARFWHRTVVLFVVLMLAGLVAHALVLVSV